MTTPIFHFDTHPTTLFPITLRLCEFSAVALSYLPYFREKIEELTIALVYEIQITDDQDFTRCEEALNKGLNLNTASWFLYEAYTGGEVPPEARELGRMVYLSHNWFGVANWAVWFDQFLELYKHETMLLIERYNFMINHNTSSTNLPLQ